MRIDAINPVLEPNGLHQGFNRNIIFTYEKLLNKHEKRLASNASSYSHAVQHIAEKPLMPENEPKFEIVYNIIASSETEAEGMLKVFV